MLEAVKKVAVTVVKSDLFKVAVIGVVSGVTVATGYELVDAIKGKIEKAKENRKARKKGLKEDDSEVVVEVVNA